jgi:hypothetical protein
MPWSKDQTPAKLRSIICFPKGPEKGQAKGLTAKSQIDLFGVFEHTRFRSSLILKTRAYDNKIIIIYRLKAILSL